MCQNFCDNREDVEEVVQDTFLIAFKKAGTLRSETLMGYLRKIAIHESLRKRNANLRWQQYNVNMDDGQAESYPELNHDFLPEAYLQDKENRTELLRIIKSLPKKQWEMIYMYYYASFSTKEIAQLCECSENNVHKTLSNARKTIKAKLDSADGAAGAKGASIVPLAAILFMEEQLFAASYIPTLFPGVASASASVAATSAGAADAAGKSVAAVAKSSAGYVVAACVAVVCSVSIIAYVATLPDADDQAIYTPAPEIEEPSIGTEPTDGYEPEPEEPGPVDRTPEILGALAEADDAEDVNDIIDYYGFVFATQINIDMRYRFYVHNEGSGDIMIGIAAYEDETGWKMKFEHFYDGTMPLDTLQLLKIMEQ